MLEDITFKIELLTEALNALVRTLVKIDTKEE